MGCAARTRTRYGCGLDRDHVPGSRAPAPSAAVIPAVTDAADSRRCSSSTSISALVPGPSPSRARAASHSCWCGGVGEQAGWRQLGTAERDPQRRQQAAPALITGFAAIKGHPLHLDAAQPTGQHRDQETGLADAGRYPRFRLVIAAFLQVISLLRLM